MTVVAMGVAPAIIAWVAVAVAFVGALAAVVLLFLVVRPALEIRRYAQHISAAGTAISNNLEGLDELQQTRELAVAVPGLAQRYLARLRP